MTRDTLPALIPARCASAGTPNFNTSLEQGISTANGGVPVGVGTLDGWALEDPQTLSATISSAPGVSQASTQQVDTVYLRAQLAANAYCRNVVPGNTWSCPNCGAVSDAKIVKSFQSSLDDTNGYFITSDSLKTIFLSFRGTNSIRSAIVDIEFVKTAYTPVSGTNVHDGFYKSYLEVQSTVLTTMQGLIQQYPNYNVEVTGHSLGAAQAVFAALDFFQRFNSLSPSNLFIYTYGEPRVGDPAFAAYVKSTNIPKIRVIHASDIVPHLPPMAMGFLHSGLEYWIKDNQSKLTQICNADFESKDCADSTVPFLSLLDHLDYYGINEGLCL
ncbi:lipase [Gongronella butleri]|nr:lipase [Gongronella butleri]